MEYYVFRNNKVVFRGNKNEVEKYFTELLKILDCPISYKQLDEYLAAQDYYYCYYPRDENNLSFKKFILKEFGITEKVYNDLRKWLETDKAIEYLTSEISNSEIE